VYILFALETRLECMADTLAMPLKSELLLVLAHPGRLALKLRLCVSWLKIVESV